MSDEKAKEKEAEEAKAKKEAEEAGKKLWVLQIVHDNEKGVTIVQPIQNVTKQWQVDLLLDTAYKNKEAVKIGRTVVELLKAHDAAKKPRLFRR